MATWREVGVNYGGQHIGKGIARLLQEVDKYAKKETAPIQKKPSTWITIAASIGLPAAAVLLKLKDPWDKLLILTGGFISTGLWDIAEKLSATPTGTTAYYTPASYIPPSQVSASESEEEGRTF
jgi:hypothetical protein